MFSKYLIKSDATLLKALEAINSIGGMDALTLFVVDEKNSVIGSLTDGDIRRKLYQGEFAEHAIAASLMTASPSCAFVQQSAAEVMDIMEQKSITVLPVVDETHALVGVVHLHDLLGKGQVKFAG